MPLDQSKIFYGIITRKLSASLPGGCGFEGLPFETSGLHRPVRPSAIIDVRIYF
jgi:hypothetical protein